MKPWKGDPISDFIKRFRKFDLLDYMNKYDATQSQSSPIPSPPPTPSSALSPNFTTAPIIQAPF